nr:hypothetical protein [Methanobrevibacter arboriphilus]
MIDCNFYPTIELCKKYCEYFDECTLYLEYPKKLKNLFEKEHDLINEVISKSKELEQIQRRKEQMISELRREKQEGIVE